MYTWIIEGKLAQSPLPPRSAVGHLANRFTGVIVLTVQHELPLSHMDYLDRLRGLGLEVLHIPTPDHHPVELLGLLRASTFIDKHVSKGGAVLVHCYGGLGRSGLVSSSYLVYRGSDVYSALQHVRSRVPGSVENQWQLQVLEDYYLLLSTVKRDLLLKYASVVEKLAEFDRASYLHISKVTQLTIELYSGLGLSNINLENELYTSMTHAHRDSVVEFIKKSTGMREGYSTGLVELSHLLDYRLDSRVVVVDAKRVDKPVIEILCSEPCEDIVVELKNNMSLLINLLGSEPLLDWGMYLDYAW